MITYLTPGCFDKGGISRYNRYQISALRQIVGEENVRVFSVLGPQGDGFETPFDVTWSAGGATPLRKAAFVARAAADAIRYRPRVILAAHVNLSGLAVSLAKLAGSRSALDIYGLEVWSGLRPDAAWGLRKADLVIADCNNTAGYVHDAGLRSPNAAIRVLWDCVDTGRFTPGAAAAHVIAKYGLPDPGSWVNVMTLGRVSASADHKGYHRLLQAFALAARSEPSLRLVYAGGGDLIGPLKEAAARVGLGDRVVFTGPIHENDLPDVYRAASIFSLVSDVGKGRGEGIPLTPLEAASCEKPILVGNQDGSREAVVDGLNGFVLEPFDNEAHASRLLLLGRDGELRRRMGRAARERILRHHDFSVFREETRDHLRQLGVA